MEERNQVITQYLNRGIIESNLDYIKENDAFVCLVKFNFHVDLDDAYTFKNFIAYLHLYCEFNPILQCPDNAFMIVMRDCKIHQAKALMQKIQRDVWHKFRIALETIAITLLDESDDYKSLTHRLDEYFVMSKLSTNKKIFYGTKDFSFYESKNDKQILRAIFKKLAHLKVHNLYKGLPVVDNAEIIAYNEGILALKVDAGKIPFYKQETFTYLQHDLIPNIIRADILKTDLKKSSLVLGHLEFLDSSPVERSGMRVEPDRKIYASLTMGSKKLCEGTITNISEGSIVIQSTQPQIERLLQANVGRSYLDIQFQLPTQKGFITTLKTKSTLFNVNNEMVVVTIYPTPLSKTKIRSYISMQQTNLLLSLKSKIKRV